MYESVVSPNTGQCVANLNVPGRTTVCTMFIDSVAAAVDWYSTKKVVKLCVALDCE